MPAARRRQITGKDVAMIFQEPMTQPEPLLHPSAFQIMETLQVHEAAAGPGAGARTVELLDQVGIPDGGRRGSPRSRTSCRAA